MTRAKDISKILTDADFSGTLDVTGETTLATHLNMGDNDIIKLGAGADLQIYHDGSHSYISDQGTGNLRIAASDRIQFYNAATDEVTAQFIANGEAELRYDNTNRLATTSTGIDVTGTALNLDGGGSNPLLTLKNSATYYSTVSHDTFNVQNNGLKLSTQGTERMRIDSSGNLLVGKTSSSLSSAGVELKADGSLIATRDSNQPVLFNRTTNDGTIVGFYKDGGFMGAIGTNGGNLFIGSTEGNDAYLAFASNTIYPSAHEGSIRDNVIDLGSSSARFDDIYATNGTIQTSDRNEKQDIEELSDAEQRVAVVAKGLMRKFRWKDSVAEKGDNARTHFGIIAQDLQDAFTAEGLDAGDYAMFCSNTWTDDDGNEKTRLGVRYNQLLAFIISAI